MKTFYAHHKGSINFAFRCFDRILLNGFVDPYFKQAKTYEVVAGCPRSLVPAHRASDQANGIPVVHCPSRERKDELAEQYLGILRLD